jgi:phage tail-like protein
MTTPASRSLRQVRPVFMRLTAAELAGNASSLSGLHADPALQAMRLGDSLATAISPGEPGGSLGGLARPTGLEAGPQGRLLLADPGGHVILSYTNETRAFRPLWPARESSPPDAYTLAAPRGLAFNREGDLLVTDSALERVMVYTWPRLGLRRILDLPGAAPWDLAFDSDGRLYIAAPGLGRVLRFDRQLNLDEDYPGGQGQLKLPRHLAFDSRGDLFVVDDATHLVYQLDSKGRASEADLNDLYRRSFTPPLRLEEGVLWLPQDERPNCPALRLDGLQVDRRGRLLGTSLPLLARPQSVRYPRSGSLYSAGLDSGIFNCAWHRLVFDVTLPPNCGLRVRTYSAAAPMDPGRLLEVPADRWSQPLVILPGDPPEILVQSPPGQFLWLRVEFFGNGEATPVLRAVTIYAPRQSSLAYLPPSFREDPASADFLDRFLSYFDTVFAEIETMVEDFAGYLDPYGVPSGEFLDWLASWFDMRFPHTWQEETRRRFIKQAVELYRQRGTLAGLQALIRLHTGVQPPFPVVIEHFRLRRLSPEDQLYLGGDPFQWDPVKEIAHHFTLVFPHQVAASEEQLTSLRRFIEAQKPAHTRFRLLFVRPGLRIGCQSTLGVDAILGGWRPAALESLVLDRSLLSNPEVDSRPRLGSFPLQSPGGFTCVRPKEGERL